MRAQWERVRQEWRQNRRLRLATLVVVLILGLHAVLGLSDRRQALAREYARDTELLARLEAVSRERAWPTRARAAEGLLAAVRKSVPAARSPGLAQAEVQAWLTEQATQAGLQGPRVRVEDTVDVPGHPDMWQVLARLDANVPAGPESLKGFLRVLAEALPWVQAERLEITEAMPTRVGLVVRAYYRKATEAEAEAAEAADAAAGTQGSAAPPTPAVPGGTTP